MASKKFPVISVKGKPFDCGWQHGSLARQQIHRNIDLYFDLWQSLFGAKRQQVLEQCRGLIPIIGEYDADILEELEGVAKGADLSIEEVIALNARYELVWAPSVTPQRGCDACTSMAALPQITKDGHTILGQNWDYKPRFEKLSIILEIEQESKPNVVILTEAGIIGFKGMNSAGVGVCVNALVSNRDRFDYRTPFFVIMRGILNADSFSQSLKAVFGTRSSVSGNVLIAHRDGEAIDLEITPEDVGSLYPEGGIITHSNHFLVFANREDLRDVFKPVIPDTIFRFQRARQLLELDKGHIDVNSFQRVFKDHFSYPNSICRHVDARDERLSQAATLSSIVLDLEERAFYMTQGSPCQNGYYKLSPQILMKE
ncbi:C45 family autoproteolytic acyltransferase/hydrolase [Chloroflexota bacterium]